MENLLDKFIRNEKKAKLWAALSLLAFFSVATSVVVVAYQIKNGKDSGQTVTTATTAIDQVPDTVFISKEDPATATLINDQAETVKTLTESLTNLQVRYDEKVKEVNRYFDLWNECKSKPPGGDPPPPPPPPPAQPISVMIYIVNLTYKVPDSSVQKLIKFISYRDNSKNGMKIYSEEVKKGENACIIYYGDEFADQANYIAKILSGSRIFNPMLRLKVIRVVGKGPADIVIWPGYFR